MKKKDWDGLIDSKGAPIRVGDTVNGKDVDGNKISGKVDRCFESKGRVRVQVDDVQYTAEAGDVEVVGGEPLEADEPAKAKK